ncbi:amidase [Roseomonas sp. BN140053]|uniref:amidase n=1 Tax=Roseomonas sp. BN140053 TaxID=3391898 RepID=UPI0039E89189
MPPLPLHYRPALDLAAALRRGECTASQLVATSLSRIARFNPAINAVVVLQAEAATERAAAADQATARGENWGPLHGVPITVKDSFDVAGLPSTFGLAALRDNRAARHSLAVQRLLDAGAILLGKTNVPPSLADWQSNNPIYGETRNPWNTGRTPGGSSGGSAAALTAGFSALEIGSDIGGSIRMPAHFCGVFGHKPSFGLVPGRGHAQPGRTAPSDITVYGPLARSAGDLRLALDLLALPDPEAGVSWRLDRPREARRTAAGFRIAIVPNDAEFPVDAGVEAALRDAAASLRRAGATVEEARPDFGSRHAYETYLTLLRGATSSRQSDAEFAASLAEAAALDPADRSYRALLARGNTLFHRDWLRAQQHRHDLIARWDRFFESYDALLCPVASTAAFPLVRDVPKHARTVTVSGRQEPSANDYFWLGLPSVSYLPATTVPLALSDEGLPIGAQIIAPFGHDDRCIALAEILEAVHHGFVPPPDVV